MKVLITGGSGFIGTNLVEYYLSKGAEVVNLDIAPPRNPEHKSCWKEMDVLNSEGLHAAVVNFSPTHIVNLAAQTGTIDRGRKLENYAANFQGVKNLIEATKDIPSLEKIIFTSSMLVCKPGHQPQSPTDYYPDTLYGSSKMLGEKVVRETKGLPYSWTIVRPTGIWGPWFEAPYTTLFKLIKMELYVHPANSHTIQSLGFVGNTVCQLDRLMRAPYEKVHTKTFYLADYPPTDLREWVDLIQKALKARKIQEVPLWGLKTVAKVGDILKSIGWSDPPLFTSRLRNLLRSYVFDLDPIITEDLPYTIEQAVEITVNWQFKVSIRERNSQPDR